MKKAIGEILKSTAKAKGLRQNDIAKTMKVSLPTVKRWLSGQGLDLDRLTDLLNFLGLSLRDLSESIATVETKEREFSLEQETAFARNVTLLNYFERLLEGKKPGKIHQELRITSAQGSRYLRELKALGLLERHPGEKIKLSFVDQPRWRMDGPLAKRLKKEAVDEFLSQNLFKSVRLGLHRINTDDLTRLEAMLVDLQAFARSAESRAKFYPDRPVSIGLLVGSGRFSWSTLTRS